MKRVVLTLAWLLYVLLRVVAELFCFGHAICYCLYSSLDGLALWFSGRFDR